MDIVTLAAIASASAINAAMPGPCIALTIGRSARDGLKAGLSVTLGVLFANLALAAVTFAIMLGVVTFGQEALAAMRWLGAAVLIALAAQMLAARRRDAGCRCVVDGSPLRDLAAGMMVGLSSPFNLVFLLALLPQFVSPHDLELPGIALIVTAVTVGAAVSQVGASLVGAASRGIVGTAARRIEYAGVLSLIGFAGITLATPFA